MSLHPLFTEEYLSIDGYIIGTHNVWAESLAPLFTRVRRGETVPMPYVAGGVSYRKRRTYHSATLVVHVFGDVDEDGDAIPDPREGLHDALADLETALLEDVDGMRTAIWHRPDGNRSAYVDVMSWTIVGDTPISAVGQLELSIASGRWEFTGS